MDAEKEQTKRCQIAHPALCTKYLLRGKVRWRKLGWRMKGVWDECVVARRYVCICGCHAWWELQLDLAEWPTFNRKRKVRANGKGDCDRMQWEDEQVHWFYFIEGQKRKGQEGKTVKDGEKIQNKCPRGSSKRLRCEGRQSTCVCVCPEGKRPAARSQISQYQSSWSDVSWGTSCVHTVFYEPS